MRDPKVEHLLDGLFIDYVYEEDIDIDQFDVEASLKNQARIDPVIYKDTVAAYLAALRDGAEFPAVVGYYENDSIILTDGNHRLSMHLEYGSTTIDAYIVDAMPEVLQALTYMGNATHGKPPTDDERLVHAIHLKDLSYTTDEAARIVQLPRHKVDRAWNLEQTTRRARRLGVIRKFERIPADYRIKLNPIDNDNVWKAAVEFLGDHIKQLNRSEILAFIKNVKEERTEKTQKTAISEFRKSMVEKNRTEGKSRTKQDARRGIIPHLAYIAKADNVAITNAVLTDDQREGLEKHLIQAVTSMNNLMKLLKEGQDD